MARQLRKLHQRAIPLEWERQLEELSPPNARFSWLKLLWEAGDPWDSPVDRFIIYQMTPAHVVKIGMPDIFDELEGESPRKLGNYYDRVLERFVRNSDVSITQRAWELWRSTKLEGVQAWGRPWWVIQGEHGGHKRWFSATEKKILRLNGFPSDPPLPGDLPYAPFDNRVVQQLQKHDLLRQTQGRLKAMREEAKRADAELEKGWRIELTKWLADQMADVAPDIHRALLKLDAPRNPNAPDWQKLQEKQEENFIETGRTDGVLIP